MKRKYISPEMEVERIQLEEMMTNIDFSNPEDTRVQGSDGNNNDDIGSGS